MFPYIFGTLAFFNGVAASSVEFLISKNPLYTYTFVYKKQSRIIMESLHTLQKVSLIIEIKQSRFQ